MILGAVVTNLKAFGDLLVRQAFLQEAEYFPLAGREDIRIWRPAALQILS
jgi:hypothetical protein